MTDRRRPLIVALAAVAVAATSCTTSGDLRAHDIAFTSPPAGAQVGLPVLLQWDPVDGAESYAVVLDRTPMPPGEGVDWFGDADDVFTTDEPQLIVGRSVSASAEARTRHEATVVVLDADGNRVGEQSGTVSFIAGGRS